MDYKDIYTTFGFKKVLLKQKEHLVKNVFDSVANKYDIMNDFMSLGTHKIWKQQLVHLLLQTNFKELVDVGGGTADVSLDFIKQGGKKSYVIDINKSMLEVGKEKVKKHGFGRSFVFMEANAENLPLEDNFTSLYSSSFCLRNVSNLLQALTEAYRILKPGGKFFCLEFSKPNGVLLQKLYDLWSFKVIPKIGKYVANDEQSYEYLVESIKNFKTQDEFAELIRTAGFVKVDYKNIFNGIVCIHSGQKI